MKEALGESVTAVRLSRKLASQPCCLTTEGGITLEMEKYFRHGPSEEMRKLPRKPRSGAEPGAPRLYRPESRL